VYQVQAPDGTTSEARTATDGTLSGVAAPTIGRYTIREGGTEVASIGVSLLTVTETSLASVEQLQFRELSVGVAGTMLKSDHPLWGAFAVIGFVLLLVEWWYFQRRPGGLVRRVESRI
jgi:hypothetical protein